MASSARSNWIFSMVMVFSGIQSAPFDSMGARSTHSSVSMWQLSLRVVVMPRAGLQS
jgi:hypothetical protein